MSACVQRGLWRAWCRWRAKGVRGTGVSVTHCCRHGHSLKLGIRSTEYKHLQRVLPVARNDSGASLKLSDILAWYTKCISTVEGAPEEHLKTELRWLIEDAVKSELAWSSIWKRANSSEGFPVVDKVVKCRMEMAELDDVWQFRLKERVPIQYITGVASWYDFDLTVGPGVLIPRPETEVLLDYALDHARRFHSDMSEIDSPKLPWLDLGTGSGALAIGLALHLPVSISVWSVEESEVALQYARENVKRCKVEDRVKMLQGSWVEPVSDMEGMFGGIVSNPPYIPEDEMPHLQREVLWHEPKQALSGGSEGGMRDLLHIVAGAPKLLAPGGFLGLETGGPEQSNKLAKILREQRWPRMPSASQSSASPLVFESVEVKPDLAGVERFVVATAST